MRKKEYEMNGIKLPLEKWIQRPEQKAMGLTRKLVVDRLTRLRPFEKAITLPSSQGATRHDDERGGGTAATRKGRPRIASPKPQGYLPCAWGWSTRMPWPK